MVSKCVLYVKGSNGAKKIFLRKDPTKKTEQPVLKESGPEITTGYIGQPMFLEGSNNNRHEDKEEDDVVKDFIHHIREKAISMPDAEMPKPSESSASIKNDEDQSSIRIRYPLIPNSPKTGERVLAYADIYFDKSIGEIVYNVVEPKLSGNDRVELENIKEFIQEKLDVNFLQIRKMDAINYIIDIFNKAVKYFRVKGDIDILKYYVVRDFIGVEIIEPLMQDKNIEDISCDGVNIPIYVYHRDPKLGSIRTNISFSTRDSLDMFVNKLAERSAKTVSVAKPLLDGTLPDGSRIQATLGTDIARHGSNFTIRMFTEEPMTPVDMLKFGTCDLKLLSFLWFLIEHQSSILVSGGTATGKTSLLNVLSLFIKPQMKIVSIEDTAELKLPHSHWVPEVARTAISEEGKVDMFELLKESLRQRPDYIIVGEVRGREAYVLFQQLAVGHAGLATIHADNFPKLMDRLTTQPIALPPNIIENLDIILFVRRVKRGRIYSRRISEIVEILGYDKKRRIPIVNDVVKWNPNNDTYTITNKSVILGKIAESIGMSEPDVKKELINKAKVLKWTMEHNVTDYKKFASIINLYYLSPDFLLSKIGG
ncbi:type II/IV secretion system ATPase subunit [archaeon]|nr:type II/IV secretion system ATPase subunit [archaeon]